MTESSLTDVLAKTVIRIEMNIVPRLIMSTAIGR